MLDKSIDRTEKQTVELPFFVERTCTDCDTNEKSVNLRPRAKATTKTTTTLAPTSLSSTALPSVTRSSFRGGGGNALKRRKCHPNAQQQKQQQQQQLKLNRNIYLCKCNRMAQSCIYFVLVLAILSVRYTCAASHPQQQQQQLREREQQQQHLQHNNQTEYGAGDNYSIYHDRNATIKYPDPILIIAETESESEASNTHNNTNNINASVKKQKNKKNSNIVEKKNKNYKKKQLQEETEEERHHLLSDSLDTFGAYRIPDEAIYTNEFAVHIPAGRSIADTIAEKYGFTNRGQIGALDDYYLFQHHRVSKRSLRSSRKHHSALKSEFEVKWLQQQHEKIRQKRDGPYSDIPTYSPYNILRQPNNDYALDPITNPYSLFSYSPDPSLTSSTTSSHSPRLKYRDVSPLLIFSDPLFKEQWYLNGGAKDGLDMNIVPAWQKGYTGKGVVVSILDDGIQTNHPDLAQNYDPDASFDINGNDSDPTPQDNGDNKHGTRCAGEVAAVAFNNYCGVGVAYNASIGGVRMLDGKVNDVVEAQALSLNPAHIDIYSASWGPEDDGSTVDGPGPLARRAFIYGVTSGRQGKGSIFVWASGNGGRYTDSCNCDGYTNSIFTLSISSATQAGYKPWYLEECSSTLATTYSSGTPGHDKSVATVDMDGRLRPDHICTVEHTGTSASAPLAAGICALALEANPDLTWRDMQYLVVYTSRPGPLEKESGWTLNGVKRKYSHKFGYGLMDAGAMVTLAEQWNSVPPQHICKSRENNEDRNIAGEYGYTLATHMDVNGCAGTINEVRYLEHVQCRITLRFFPRGNLRILLTSPMGTTSTLLFERPRDIVKSNFDDWPFLSVHFWGEKAEGRWTLQVINSGRRRVNQPGILSKWQLIFYGTSSQPMRLKSELLNTQLRNSPVASNPFIFSSASNIGQPANEGGNFNTDNFAGYLNYQNIFSSAGSSPEVATATLDGHSVNTSAIVLQQQQQLANVNGSGDNKLIMYSCDAECGTLGCYGRGPTQCVACSHYRLDNTCVSRCPPRSFPNQVGICWPCHDSCETCAGAGPDSCLTCAPAHLHVTDLAVCVQNCPDGYFEDMKNRTCVPCEPNCASCQDRPEFCTSCDHHLVMHENKCYSACPLDSYETEENKCAYCHSSCATCNGATENDCITCRPSRYAWQNKCLNNCPEGHYADKKRLECLPCHEGCKSCSSNGICSECLPNWTLNKKDKCSVAGSEACTDSEFYSQSESGCKACHSSCETCNGPLATNCLSCESNRLLEQSSCVSGCQDGYFMETGVCTPCLHTCTQCKSRTNCSNCSKGLELQNGECRTTCADGYYSDRGICAKCYLSCHTCSGPRRNQCVQCPDGWQLAAGECYPKCPEGFYKSEFGCQKCHHYCKTCNGAGPLACSSCPPNFMLDGGLCMECLSTQYYDATTQTCKACHESCHSCLGPGQYSCKACVAPLHLDRVNGQCVPCCRASKKTTTEAGEQQDNDNEDDEHCCQCDADTGECRSTSTAGKRRTVVGIDSIFRSAVRDRQQQLPGELNGGGGGGVFVFRLDSPLTAITAIAVAICLLIITIFSIIFAVLQRNSNHTSRNSVRYRKINGRKCEASNEARFIFNVGENGDDTDSDDDNDMMDNSMDTTRRRMNNQRIVYEQQHHNRCGDVPPNGNEFYVKSTNDIDAIEFHGNSSSSKHVNNPDCSSNSNSPTTMNPPIIAATATATTTTSSSSSNNRRIVSRNNYIES
ncbi:furin-like protease 2 isoform X2 [Drosophila sulfurigaster albostrigata]|uniref:furin-like protease 2 isoform X2 n=1 Tax=Drosophila sulfurigaster albostrigata TaxID=89887 RepID=UPI002D21A067|nr:furin-like protease 2 isoform X2 [Drosophila sulfurigaster albostrigata]